MKIPLCAKDILTKEAVLRVLDNVSESNEADLSEMPSILENKLCEITGAAYALTANDRCGALKNILYAWSVCGKEAVFVPSFADPCVLFAVMECGAVPIFVDCDRDSWHMKAEKLENAVKKCMKQNELYPRAVIISDTFGMPFDPATIESVCTKYGLLLIEDATSALCAKVGKRCAGTFGDASVVSVGDSYGGSCSAILTNDAALARNLRLVANCGQKVSDSVTGSVEIIRKGSNPEAHELTSAMKIAEINEISLSAARRRENAKKLQRAVKETSLRYQSEPEGTVGAYPFFAVKAQSKEEAERMIKALLEEGIECRALYSKPLCRNSAFKELGCQATDVPVGSDLSVCTFLLPCHEKLTDEQIDYMCEKIKVICV